MHDPRFSVAPLRLMAMKNGERDARLAMPCVGPNLTNVILHY